MPPLQMTIGPDRCWRNDPGNPLSLLTSEWAWVSLRKRGIETPELFAEWMVYLVQQTEVGRTGNEASCLPGSNHWDVYGIL